MTTDPLALVAAMPMQEPCTLVEVFEPGFRLPVEAEPASDYYTADQYRAARLEAAQLVLAQGEPVAWAGLSEEQAKLLRAYAAAHCDWVISGHASAEAYAALAKSCFIDSLSIATPAAPANAEVLAAPAHIRAMAGSVIRAIEQAASPREDLDLAAALCVARWVMQSAADEAEGRTK